MCRENVENVLSGTKAGFKATRNLVFNQKAERNTMKRQKSRRILENVLSGTKAGFKATRNLVFNQKAERSTMNRQKSRGIVENGLSGTKAGFNNLVFNQKAEKVKMERIIRSIVENGLSGTKAGFKSILNLESKSRKEKDGKSKKQINLQCNPDVPHPGGGSFPCRSGCRPEEVCDGSHHWKSSECTRIRRDNHLRQVYLPCEY